MTRYISAALAAAVVSTFCAFADPIDASSALARRLLGDRARSFRFELLPPGGPDAFEIECSGGIATIRGTNGVAMASGLNWFLKYACNASVSWGGDQLALPNPLPDLAKLRKETPHHWRYCFNYCTFSYTMAWWNWDRWEREIDWMALNGINMPLSVTGQEAIWQKVYHDLGLTAADLDGFFVGPAYLPFGWMGCMDAWADPLTPSWIDRHRDLEKRIVARERELGMTPVLQGFTGHVPPALKDRFPDARLQQVSPWCAFPATYFLDPGDPLFVQIGKAFVEEQTRQFGTDHLYASDTFIEMSPPSSDPAFLAAMGKTIHGAMTAADPEAVWVMQGWIFFNNPTFWKPPQAQALLGAVPDDRMIVLDLFCDAQPVWTSTDAFHGTPWLWCIVHNFGGTPGMYGNLSTIANGPPAALKDPRKGKMSGIGMMMEAIEQNPVVYDLMMEMTWRTEAPHLDEWIRDYARRRYGQPNGDAEQAWKILLDTLYSNGNRGSAMDMRPEPSMTVPAAEPARLASIIHAWELLLGCADAFAGLDPYQYDVVNLGRQLLSDMAGPLAGRMLIALDLGDAKRFAVESKRFLACIGDMDGLLGTRKEFLLGRWIADARYWGDTDAEKRHYEWNARNQITLWGPRDSVLHDYARKQWSGLLNGFYLRRWELFTDWAARSLKGDTALDAKAFAEAVMDMEDAWTHEDDHVADTPHGDPIAIARALLDKYRAMAVEISAPEMTSLTTGKPASCSHALDPYPASLANDGRLGDTTQYWATDTVRGENPWWQTDLESATRIGRVVVVAYYGDKRYYGFIVETSLDGKTWELAADRRDNKEPSTRKGYVCRFEPRDARYVRVTETANSANTGRHLVEVLAFER